MVPVAVVRRAVAYGLDVIAITDHNSIANAEVFVNEGKKQGLIVVPGMEMTTSEGIHVICLFETLDALCLWNEYLSPYKTTMKNNSRYFGHQWVISESGEKLREEKSMLFDSMGLSVDDVIPAIH
jgi:predicted metal-dependent phosphoesterase TrpH